jgi:hypothetical protein
MPLRPPGHTRWPDRGGAAALRDDEVDAVVVHLRLGEGEARNRRDGADVSVAELLFALGTL